MEGPPHRPDPAEAGHGGVGRHGSLDAQRDGDVLPVHEQVHEQVVGVRDSGHGPGGSDATQSCGDLLGGSLGVVDGDRSRGLPQVAVRPDEGGDEGGHARLRDRAHRHVRGDVSDPPTLTQRLRLPLGRGEGVEQISQAQPLAFHVLPACLIHLALHM